MGGRMTPRKMISDDNNGDGGGASPLLHHQRGLSASAIVDLTKDDDPPPERERLFPVAAAAARRPKKEAVTFDLTHTSDEEEDYLGNNTDDYALALSLQGLTDEEVAAQFVPTGKTVPNERAPVQGLRSGKTADPKIDESLALAQKLLEEDKRRGEAIEHSRKLEKEGMEKSPTGQAWNLVHTVIRTVEEFVTTEGPPDPSTGDLSTLIEPVTRDDMVFLAERMILKQREFEEAEKPTDVCLGYHYTRKANLDRIRTDGLLSRLEREASNIQASNFNGASYGEGIYTGNDPVRFRYYGDKGLIVLRLLGQELEYSPSQRDYTSGNNSIVCTPNHLVVLQHSSQCLAMVQYEASLISNPAGKTIIERLASKLEAAVIDAFFHSDSKPRRARMRQPAPASGSITFPPFLQPIPGSTAILAGMTGLAGSAAAPTTGFSARFPPVAALSQAGLSPAQAAFVSQVLSSAAPASRSRLSGRRRVSAVTSNIQIPSSGQPQPVMRSSVIGTVSSRQLRRSTVAKRPNGVAGSVGASPSKRAKPPPRQVQSSREAQVGVAGRPIEKDQPKRRSGGRKSAASSGNVPIEKDQPKRRSGSRKSAASSGNVPSRSGPSTAGSAATSPLPRRRSVCHKPAVSNRNAPHGGGSAATAATFLPTKQPSALIHLPIYSARGTKVVQYTAPATVAHSNPSSLFAFVHTAGKAAEDCPICLDSLDTDVTVVSLHACSHLFHESCALQTLGRSRTCPTCRTMLEEPQGRMPSGTMTISFNGSLQCSGTQSTGVIIVHYQIPVDVQKPYHDNPGTPHSGAYRTAYLPDNDAGRKLLARLEYAFSHGLTFTVGTSLTTGQPNCVTWSSIHHKTSLGGGVHGYPDPNYFDNCNAELDALGVPKA